MSMKKNAFIGRNGSRKTPVDRLLKFLTDDDDQWLALIYGVYGIGKTEVVKRAIWESLIEEKRMIEIEHDQYRLFLTIHIGGGVVEKEDTPTDLDARPTRFPSKNIEQKIKTRIRKIKDAFVTLGINEEIPLIWHVHSEADISHINLLNIITDYCDDLKIKLIFERRKYTDPFGKPMKMLQVLITAFTPDEADECLNNKLQFDVDLNRAIRLSIRRLCGRHPGFLDLLCDLVKSTPYNYSWSFKEGTLHLFIEEQLLDMHCYRCRGEVMTLFTSLSEPTRQALSEKNWHSLIVLNELTLNGLLLDAGDGKTNAVEV